MGIQAGALLAMLNAACDGLEQLDKAHHRRLRATPGHDVIVSLPGLGELSGARVLAEIATTVTDSPTPKRSRPTPAPRR